MNAVEKHIRAIRAGMVDRGNVIGLRKALNAYERLYRGYTVSRTASVMTAEQRGWILDDGLPVFHPTVVGPLFDSGVALLTNPRHRKRLESVAEIVADIRRFDLVGFDFIGPYGLLVTPVYRAINTDGKSFTFCNVPWQSGGNGPEILRDTLW